MSPSHCYNKIFLTGMPGVGKTTCIIRLVENLNQIIPTLSLAGFYTQECRQQQQRIGFDIIEYVTNNQDISRSGAATTTTIVVPLARVATAATSGDQKGRNNMPTVGKYSVYVDNVQSNMVRALQSQPPQDASVGSRRQLTVMDEVGKMELLCKEFFPAVWNHLNTSGGGGSNTAKEATIGTLPMPKKPIRQVDRILARDDVLVLLVTKTNRDQLIKDLTYYFKSLFLGGDDGGSTGQPFVACLKSYQYQKQKEQQQQQQQHKRQKQNSTSSQIHNFDRHLTPGGILSSDHEQHLNNSRASQRPPRQPNGEVIGNKNNQSSSTVASPLTNQHLKPCGPIFSNATPPRILLLGETASPLPENDNDMAYSERSMWNVLARVILGNNPQDNEYLRLKRSTLDYGIAIWDVLANVHDKQKQNRNNNARASEDSPNDLSTFLLEQSSIQACCFIGTKAHQTFRKYHKEATQKKYPVVGATKDGQQQRTVDLIVLPSSSRSNRLSLADKASRWKSTFDKYK